MALYKRAALVIALCCGLAWTATAQNGVLSPCSNTPLMNSSVKIPIGYCQALSSGAVATGRKYTYTGNATMYMFALDNCGDRISTTIEFNFTFYSDQFTTPLRNFSISGYAKTAPATATGTLLCQGTTRYTDQPTGNTTNPSNILGWTTATTDSRGSVCGAVANEWVARTVTLLPNGTRRSDGNQLRSLQIGSVADGDGILLCCDFGYMPKQANYTDAFAGLRKCKVPPPPPPLPPSPPPQPGAPGSPSGGNNDNNNNNNNNTGNSPPGRNNSPPSPNGAGRAALQMGLMALMGVVALVMVLA